MKPGTASIGGKAAADKLTPEERSERARRMSQARWAKYSTPEERAAEVKRNGLDGKTGGQASSRAKLNRYIKSLYNDIL
jgi:hypothetical protein